MKFKPSLIAIALSFGLSACAERTAMVTETTAETTAPQEVQELTESQKANQMFDEIFMAGVMRSPIYQTYMAIKQDYDKWDDTSEARAEENYQFTLDNLARIKTIDVSKLDAQTAMSHQLFVQQLENQIANHKWRYHNYPVNQMFGTHSMVPSLLINQHQITDVSDAEAYISRLNGVEQLFTDLILGLEKRAELGIIAPKFVYPYVISDSQNLLTGAPFDDNGESTLLADFTRKVNALDIEQAEKDRLISEANTALAGSFKSAYESLIATLQSLEERADTRDGAWKFPNGEEFFNTALANTTTTSMTADEIHEVGLAEVARIHDEMREIMKKVEFDGTLQEFFEFMRVDPQFYYEETDEGKARYISEAVALIDNMKSRLDELFIVKPKADMIVKQVEAFREKSAGKAFYQQPAPDGSRPGTYYANLYRMSDMPTYQMEALAYHEGIPGHHMQIAIAMELEGIPMFRKFGRYTAYTEGWGLYSELIPKEIGLYEDPYSDFGRLAMELWRACRLVVDTGIHAKQWTREQGIDYYVTNTPNPQPDAVKMVERHIVMPSQATAYKIGMLKILELREAAKAKLGDKFNLPEFHDVVLKSGPVPLNVLEGLVNEWVASKA
ncbi:DUF885 family protein [Alteromonas sp. KUL49]|uniref:DUF885 domain-containing protein n=2 Tax=Alteromonas sp. KUL49 TaxID=2480798 RepID=UPI00102EEBE1|nr:DUF885 domain-containing protein [Alteromonas sp. KUL49]GEA10100.1 hypothetical protein KUL49_04750 [Alteromonas sp. KUL49]